MAKLWDSKRWLGWRSNSPFFHGMIPLDEDGIGWVQNLQASKIYPSSLGKLHLFASYLTFHHIDLRMSFPTMVYWDCCEIADSYKIRRLMAVQTSGRSCHAIPTCWYKCSFSGWIIPNPDEMWKNNSKTMKTREVCTGNLNDIMVCHKTNSL